MLLVLIVHCNGWLVGGIPDSFDENNISTFRISQAIIQSFSCTCVNMFILISGYFGLKFKLKSIVNIYLTLIFIKIPLYLFNCILGGGKLTLFALASNFFAFSQSGYFVECYLMLMFLSPVLNAFVEKNKKQMTHWVLGFLSIELYFAFIMNVEELGFNNGYSVIHFVLMYMLGRTIFLNRDYIIRIKKRYYFIIYLISTLSISCIYFLFDKKYFSYISPLNIVSTCCFFIPFCMMNFFNKWINWIASSTFAVYLIHTSYPIIQWLRNFDMTMLQSHTYLSYVSIMGIVILILFFSCIIYDKVIKIIIKPINNLMVSFIQNTISALQKNLAL